MVARLELLLSGVESAMLSDVVCERCSSGRQVSSGLGILKKGRIGGSNHVFFRNQTSRERYLLSRSLYFRCY
jgi:hypothetical protein